ncbi:MAG: hypothetical protein L6V93_17965 [Clostridiales bacterium]|nr:MAG: hypothetical protein L6V93_17965 [Clostridiales bacterium]
MKMHKIRKGIVRNVKSSVPRIYKQGAYIQLRRRPVVRCGIISLFRPIRHKIDVQSH